MNPTVPGDSTTNNVVDIADRMLDRIEAAAFIREALGLPLEAIDLERAAKSGSGPIYRLWRRKPVYRRGDLMAWATDHLSAPILPRVG